MKIFTTKNQHLDTVSFHAVRRHPEGTEHITVEGDALISTMKEKGLCIAPFIKDLPIELAKDFMIGMIEAAREYGLEIREDSKNERMEDLKNDKEWLRSIVDKLIDDGN